MLLFAFLVHAPAMSENPAGMGNMMKNIALAGAALMYDMAWLKILRLLDNICFDVKNVALNLFVRRIFFSL